MSFKFNNIAHTEDKRDFKGKFAASVKKMTSGAPRVHQRRHHLQGTIARDSHIDLPL